MPASFISSYCRTDLQACLQGAYNFGFSLAVAAAFLMIVIGAFQYLLGAAINTKEAGKKRITGSIVGLTIIGISGTILYWINPNIFRAELITFRVSDLSAPTLGAINGVHYGKEGFAPGAPIPTAPPPPIVAGSGQAVSGVLVTRYYAPRETQTRFPQGNFAAEVRMEGTGRCENPAKERVCDQYDAGVPYSGYISYNRFQKRPAPIDSCGYRAVGLKTIAVPPQWHPAIVEINAQYYRGQKIDDRLGTFYGTDRGSAIVGKHIDIYVGEGQEQFANLAAFDHADLIIHKLSNCNDPRLRNNLTR